jgi:hypothetical protein
VWQRAWTGAVRAAVAGAQPELSGLRVLVLEVSPDGTTRRLRPRRAALPLGPAPAWQLVLIALVCALGAAFTFHRLYPRVTPRP